MTETSITLTVPTIRFMDGQPYIHLPEDWHAPITEHLERQALATEEFERRGKLLDEIANTLYGPPPQGTRHPWHALTTSIEYLRVLAKKAPNPRTSDPQYQPSDNPIQHPPYYMVLDVESVGLLGAPFAVGLVVIQPKGKVMHESLHTIDPDHAHGHPQDREWIQAHVPPLPIKHKNEQQMCLAFWNEWRYWKGHGAILAADCPYPVEHNFLAHCIHHRRETSAWHLDDPFSPAAELPYPLLDIATALHSAGRDPIGEYHRQSDEWPKHNPLMDARQSARLLLECLNGTAVQHHPV